MKIKDKKENQAKQHSQTKCKPFKEVQLDNQMYTPPPKPANPIQMYEQPKTRTNESMLVNDMYGQTVYTVSHGSKLYQVPIAPLVTEQNENGTCGDDNHNYDIIGIHGDDNFVTTVAQDDNLYGTIDDEFFPEDDTYEVNQGGIVYTVPLAVNQGEDMYEVPRNASHEINVLLNENYQGVNDDALPSQYDNVVEESML